MNYFKKILKNKKRLVRCISIFLILQTSKNFAFNASAQPYFFRNYQVENGLSNNTVYCSLQDKKGFLWFGTKDGLNRFDGYHFKVFNVTENEHKLLNTNYTNCLMTDNDVLWIGCRKGIYTYNYDKEKLKSFSDTLEEINGLQVDGRNNIWIISKDVLYRYNFDTKKTKKFPNDKFFSATSLCRDAQNQIWVSTADGFIKKYDEKTEQFTSYNVFAHSPFATSNFIPKIYATDNNIIYIGTSSQGLKEFDVKTSTYKDVLTHNPDKSSIHVRDILRYSKNEYWFATESGIFILNTITKKFTNLKKKFLDPFSLDDNAVYTLCMDNEGGVWAGTYFGGINYYSKNNGVFHKYFPDNSKKSISGNAVREICEDQFGNIWIGTEDAGLNKLNRKTGVITQYIPTGKKNSIAYSNIHGLLAVGNELWIGTFEHGLDVMDINSGKIIRHYNSGLGKKQLKSNFIVSLFRAKLGDIYVGCSYGLYKYDSKNDGFDIVKEVEPNIFVPAMLEDYEHKIWIATHNGVAYFNPKTGEKGRVLYEPDKDKSLSHNQLNSMFEDSEQCLWFATEGRGVWKLSKDRKTLTSFTTSNGLPSNFILKILEDANHKIWITTSRGLVNYNPDNGNFITYTKNNGLLGDQFNYNSGYMDITGKMYFGSVKGMVTFNPNDLVKEKIDAPLYITDFIVQNKQQEIDGINSVLKSSIVTTNEVILPYDKSSFSIDFAALSYISPDVTIYSYFMQGLDKEWTELKHNRKVYFTNLSTGKYVFKLKASINGNWSKMEKQLIIIILPPWWASIWAYLFYTIVIVSLAYYLLRTYHIIVEDKKEKEIYESKIDFFTSVAHEIRTPLTLIKGPVENLLEQVYDLPQIKEDVVLMERNTDRLIKLVSQILDFRKIETKGFILDYTEVNVTKLLQTEFHTFEDLAKRRNLKYILKCDSEDVFAFTDEEALTKIFSNLFNNAIKYAHKKVSIRLLNSSDSSTFTIEFENDGLIIPIEMRTKIFEPFYRLKETLKQQGTGIGLSLTMSLTELLHGKVFVKDTDDGLNVFVLSLPLK
jgi:ligand-binding sensor domain-containing protein/signal transduction histidine kinase